MASISLPPQSRSGFSQHFDSLPANVNRNHRLSMPAPLPNPPFVFPARDPDAPEPQPETLERRAPLPALPAFSFNPGSEQSSQPAQAPSRPNGHRRRPSEFVGGDQLVTPGTGDNADKREAPATPSQPSAPPGPPAGRTPGRRHHAHRRSAAVSGVDLNAISKALGTNTAAASAPGTPGQPMLDNGKEDISKPLSHSASSLGRPTPPASPQLSPVPPIPAAIHIHPAPCNDDAEIGRPVSAAETPATPPTVKFQQPENDSPAADQGTPQNHKSKSRPRTADASLAFDLIQSKNSPEASPIKRSKSTGHSRSRKSLSTGHLDATLVNSTSDDAHSTDTSRPSYSDDGSETSSDVDHEEGSSVSAKKPHSKSKKQKRVRSWAGSILTRGKGKRHVKGETETPAHQALTPPALTRTNSDVGSVMEVDFDNDDVVVLRTPTNPDAPVTPAEPVQEEPFMSAPSLESSWKPRSFYEQTVQDQGDTLSSPIIDLDAALGPFNTPDMRPATGAPSKFSVATQRMYSGGRRGEFIGPEMRYHRRAESAPVMPPFDRSSLSVNRLGVTSAETPDVFYEEEEDAFLAANQSPNQEDAPTESAMATSSDEDSKSAKSNDSANTLTKAPKPSSPQQTGLGIQPADDGTTSQETSTPVQQGALDAIRPSNSVAQRPRRPVEIMKSEENVPKALGPSPDISPRYLAVDKRPATSPHELTPSIPPFSLSANVSPSDSSFPSPDARRSFTDRNFSSHSYHHLPSDYHYASVDDVPSLTSSASTTTNTRHRFSASFISRGRLSTDRATSFSAALNRRSSPAHASKRSSLASLSKLVGGQNSERSKLYQEEKPPSDPPEKSKKKGRRLSRLMQFWKPRDKDRPDTETITPSERPL
ncbi:uncharacterized protein N7459_007291 [Penicillium hispanicum]|uniref:uncharacterized protein n=1 Tax=Penicillium hispanicum TaxID=1080232 RepID=UPI002541E09F|nr:uncharacterized protein N7459_007291 [Penicillium hispanicum]KAJ5578327.1 hypothetical protein N7459_007291 [Penicillium hispanicum]